MKCEICGKEFEKSRWYKPFNLICSNDCFSEKLWRDIEQEQLLHNNRIIIDGKCYYNSTNKNSSFKGFGGTKFKIRMFTGEIIETNNLWHNGTIPESHREILKDNAEFVKGDNCDDKT